MRRHLHLLHPLRCFDSASRHLSFAKAAAELDVTPAAVSHQIRQLEDVLGTRLFDRLARGVMLTPAGERLAATMSESFAHIDSAVDAVIDANDIPKLRLAVAPGLCCRWLVPRLPAFRARQAGFELHLQYASNFEAFAWHEVEVALVWATRRPPQPGARRLFGTGLTPVCAPELSPPSRRLDSPAALRHLPLLHEDGFEDWQRWMNLAGVPDVSVRRGQIIDETNALLMAAIDGQGVALGRTALIGEDLRRGRLIAPFGVEIAAVGAYWLVPVDEAVCEGGKFLALWDFLRDEAAAQCQPAAPLEWAA